MKISRISPSHSITLHPYTSFRHGDKCPKGSPYSPKIDRFQCRYISSEFDDEALLSKSRGGLENYRTCSRAGNSRVRPGLLNHVESVKVMHGAELSGVFGGSVGGSMSTAVLST
jgi:hypothetical protein